jgi:transcriptional regulator with XRE-family HTH domain
MPTKDELIGRNVARLRGDMSQSDLAKAMRDRGYKWSQATVWSVEKGERPLRLSEAETLTEVLGRNTVTGAAEFLASTAEMQIVASLERVALANKAFNEAMSAYFDALDDLATSADLVSEQADAEDVPDFRWFGVRNWLEEHSPIQEAITATKLHQLEEDTRHVDEEMVDREVKTFRELVQARDAEARELGSPDYESEWMRNMRVVGNYSRMRTSVKQTGDAGSGKHKEEA